MSLVLNTFWWLRVFYVENAASTILCGDWGDKTKQRESKAIFFSRDFERGFSKSRDLQFKSVLLVYVLIF